MMRSRGSVGWYALMLRLLPADFRARHGDEMVRLFEDMWRARRGLWDGAHLWVLAVGDVARSAWREWTARWSARGRVVPRRCAAADGDGRRGGVMDDTIQDVGYAVRQIAHRPGFAAVHVATLALGIAATTVMFSVVDAVLLRPLPYRAPEQLTMVWTGVPGEDARDRPDYLTFEEWRRRGNGFADMAAFDPTRVTLTDTEGAERISVTRITPNLLPLLGVQPLHGRGFSAEEAEQRQRLAVISHAFWQSRFGGFPDAIGASIELDGRPSRIIGILPADFRFSDAGVFEPHTMFPEWEATGNEGSWFVVGRLRPSITLGQVQEEMTAIARALDEERPAADRNRGVSVVPLSRHVVGPGSRLALWMLIGAVFCVLLIAAANVVGLSLARSVGRAREFAVRATLGASAPRIVRQLLAESLTLAAIAGLLGTLLAVGGIRLIRAFGPGDLPRLNEANLDLRVFGWVLAVSLVAGVVVGLAPALTTLRRNQALSGAEGGRGMSAGVATRRIRRGLVVAEFALAIMLLAGAGLLVRSWSALTSVDPGFAPERLLSMNVSTTAFESDGERVTFYADVLEQVESIPGVESAGTIGDLFTDGDVDLVVTTEGTAESTSTRVRLRIDEVSDHLFTTLRTPLHQGRFFSVEDRPGSPPVAIINEAMSRRLWSGRDPVGTRFRFGAPTSEAPWITIVGVVGDMRRQGLETDPVPQVFVPFAQRVSGNEILLVRTSTDDPMEMVERVQAAVHRVDRQVPLSFATVEDQLGADLTQRRFQTSLLIGFSIVALVMAAIGIYGLIHYSVATRTREIGLRIAVGARAGHIFRVTVWEGLRLSVAGLLIGLLGALWVGRAGSSLLFGVTATDPLTLAAVSLLLTAVAATACYFPARRAMRVDPLTALRHD